LSVVTVSPPKCQKCQSGNVDVRRNTSDFKCRECAKVFQPDKNPYQLDTIAWHICEELFVGGTQWEVAIRVQSRIPEFTTDTTTLYYRVANVIRELRYKGYEVIRVEDGKEIVYTVNRGISAEQYFQLQYGRGRFRERKK